ncbi:MAG TPA: nitrilase-related carbon-nitrogen hydrolase [Terrimicrobiaceae bacterium]|nr:nitrilase-related carbon-nitrogen hydrolase [Terrimicrobiaceae bacterium]
MPREQAAHCKANAVFAVFCNQWGYNGHSTHEGGAWILSPRGRILARGDEALGDTMIVAEIDLADAEQARRSSHCTLRTRRPEIYGVITELQ